MSKHQNAFKQVRDGFQLNQHQYAKALGISQSQVSKLEKGIYTPTIAVVYMISKVFHIDANVFITQVMKEIKNGKWERVA